MQSLQPTHKPQQSDGLITVGTESYFFLQVLQTTDPLTNWPQTLLHLDPNHVPQTPTPITPESQIPYPWAPPNSKPPLDHLTPNRLPEFEQNYFKDLRRNKVFAYLDSYDGCLSCLSRFCVVERFNDLLSFPVFLKTLPWWKVGICLQRGQQLVFDRSIDITPVMIFQNGICIERVV